MTSEVVYWTESLPGNRGQLHRDVVVRGQLRSELSGPIGSPAPLDTVRTFEHTVTLDMRGADEADLADQILLASMQDDGGQR